ncbi:MAG: T9SS type A sorting domain-containing protein [Candidatus Cloacimonetes bacterium]|nr:T9SS type A sorting domain-containing protein [Candidatus Cloacimonadota bacterium]MDD4148105.1 T9SS type A sorting domain-containing protein [Candidatus Cloacimonadota bacterium]
MRRLISLMFWYLALVMLLIPISLDAQNSHDWNWVNQISGVSQQRAQATVCDMDDNVYICGFYQLATTFGTITLDGYGDTDIYVAKLDPDGNWLWATRAGGGGPDEALDIDVDDEGNVYVTGGFESSAIFGDIVLESQGNKDIFAAKLDSDGNWLWATGAGCFDGDQAYSIAVDTDGSSCITGFVGGTVSFGAIEIVPYGYFDCFLAKLSADGNWEWANRAGGTNHDEGKAVTIDDSGYIYLTGRYRGIASFGELSLNSHGANDGFIAKLDVDGNWLWARTFGGYAYYDDVWDISLDLIGNCFITGDFYTDGTFGDFVLQGNGSQDLFVAAIDSSGTWLWANSAGAGGSDSGVCLVVDNNQNTFVSGNFQQTLSFGVTQITAVGNWDIFYAILDSNGNWTWATSIGNTGNDWTGGIAFDSNYDVCAHGTFYNSVPFGDIILTSIGGTDAYIALLDPDGSPVIDPHVPSVSDFAILYNPMPNPAFKGSQISVDTSVSQATNAVLEMYNIRGQLLQTHLVNAVRQTFIFDSEPLASGVYLFRLKCKDGSSIKKISVIK